MFRKRLSFGYWLNVSHHIKQTDTDGSASLRFHLAFSKDVLSFRHHDRQTSGLTIISGIGANAIRVGGVVVVGVAIVVDISKVRGRTNRTQPPVRTINKEHPKINRLLLLSFQKFII